MIPNRSVDNNFGVATVTSDVADFLGSVVGNPSITELGKSSP